MIIWAILKNWRTILDILLVLALIIFIFLWNPFNIFGDQLKLQDTSNMVSEIKEIGELVTAEYYGEVIASHEEAELDIVDMDSIEILGEVAYIDLKQFIYTNYFEESEEIEEHYADVSNDNRRTKKIRKDLLKVKADIIKRSMDYMNSLFKTNEDLNKSLVLFIGVHEHRAKIRTRKFVRKNDKDKDKYVNNILNTIIGYEYDRIVKYANGDIAYANYLDAGFQTHARYTNFFYDYLGASKPGKERRKELALIGRGWVKAGFKFDELNEQNLVYDKNNKVIYVYGFSAEILDQDINPWFIPERKVPGFQIVAERNADFYMMKDLKMHCIEKLKINAKQAGIMEQAQQNGEESLKEFFTLLTGEGIDRVVFRSGSLAIRASSILEDTVISVDELTLIDSTINKYLISLNDPLENQAIIAHKKKLLKQFLSELSTGCIRFPKEDTVLYYHFNLYNRYIPQLLRDSIITTTEIQYISENVRHNIAAKSSDSLAYQQPSSNYWYWYDDSLAYLNDYNQFIDHLIYAPVNNGFYQIDSLTSLNFALSGDPIERNKDIEKINNILGIDTLENAFNQLLGDSVLFYRLIKVNDSSYLKYPIKDGISIASSFIKIDSVLQWYDTSISKIDKFPRYTSFKKDSSFSTKKMDATLFKYPISIDSSSITSTYDHEVQVLRNYIMEQNRYYNDLGPVMKLRRWVDTKIEENAGVNREISALNKTVNSLAKRIREGI